MKGKSHRNTIACYLEVSARLCAALLPDQIGQLETIRVFAGPKIQEQRPAPSQRSAQHQQRDGLHAGAHAEALFRGLDVEMHGRLGHSEQERYVSIRIARRDPD